MTAPVSDEVMSKLVARRRATYGKTLGREPGQAGPYHVYDLGGKRLGQFSRVRRAMKFVDEGCRLQPHDKANKPMGSPTSPGVIVVRGQTLLHTSPNVNVRSKEFKGLLESLGLAPQE